MDFNAHSDASSVHPLLGEAKHEGEDRTTYSTILSLENDWIVNEHRFRGSTGLFPATGYLEMVRAAMADMTGASALSISDFYVSQPLKVEPNSTQPVRLLMRKARRGLPIFRANPVWSLASMDRMRVRCDSRQSLRRSQLTMISKASAGDVTLAYLGWIVRRETRRRNATSTSGRDGGTSRQSGSAAMRL